ncbi:MAG: hypothetical protein WB987_09620 [Candidatus Acidiferrales bacterium]
MKTRHLTSAVLAACAVITLGSHAAVSREPAPAGAVPVHMVVTVEARRGAEVPDIKPQDVIVRQGKERVQVTDWVPLRGEHAGLQLFVLVDDALRPISLGPQLEDLHRFINSQPETTAIGIGYMRDGTVDIVQNLTTEHAQAAKALRLPLGTVGAMASPYLSIGDLIRRWPEGKVRREILVVSDGIDRFGGVGPANSYVDTTIEQAQRAGIIIHAIYATGVGHYGHTFWRFNWGQNYLSEMASETGGEAYFQGFETPVSFAPYLEDLTRRVTHQYLLTFLTKPEKKPSLQSVKLWTEVPNAELVAADKVYVPGE